MPVVGLGSLVRSARGGCCSHRRHHGIQGSSALRQNLLEVDNVEQPRVNERVRSGPILLGIVDMLERSLSKQSEAEAAAAHHHAAAPAPLVPEVDGTPDEPTPPVEAPESQPEPKADPSSTVNGTVSESTESTDSTEPSEPQVTSKSVFWKTRLSV